MAKFVWTLDRATEEAPKPRQGQEPRVWDAKAEYDVRLYYYLGKVGKIAQVGYLNPGVRVRPAHWSFVSGKVIKHPRRDELNETLEAFESHVRLAADGCATKVQLAERIKTATSGSAKLWEFVRDYSKEINPAHDTMKTHGTVANYVKDWREGITVEELTPALVGEFVEFMNRNLNSGRGGKRSTVINYAQALSGALHRAVGMKVIPSSPYVAQIVAEAAGEVRVNLDDVDDDEEGHNGLSRAERDLLFALPMDKDPTMRRPTIRDRQRLAHAAFRWSCYTGMRRADVMRMRKSWIRLIDGETWLVFKPSKKNKDGAITVRQNLDLLFDGDPGKFIREHLESVKGERVFPLTVFQIWKYVGRWCDRLGIAHRVFHDARHTFGSLMREEGYDLDDIQLYMGHRSGDSTVIYANLSQEKANEKAREVHDRRKKRLEGK